jgi:ribosomal protein S18 acetylase RimI-like enzyme
VSVRLERKDFRVLRGEPGTFTKRGDSGNELTRHFCRSCGSPIYTSSARHPEHVHVKAGTLDDPELVKPDRQTWLRSAVAWSHIDPSLPGFPQSREPTRAVASGEVKRASGVAIRRIASGDAEAFRACLDEVARERRFLAHVEAPPLERVRPFIEGNAAEDAAQFVALADGSIVGWCDILAHAPEGTRHCGVLGMGVRAAYRGRGLGRRLIEACMAHARERGMRRIELEVWASNLPAIGLYVSLGFEREGFKRRARELDGAIEDCVCMAWLEA